jgi:CRP/FNR family transcriptional regulator
MLEAVRKLPTHAADAVLNALPSAECEAGRRHPVIAGRQRQGALWSDMDALCSLMRMPPCPGLTEISPLFQHRHYRSGQCIHTIGQPFDTLFVVYSGFLKTMLIDDGGDEQVLSFPMKGDLFGVDGIHSRRHSAEAMALTDCDLVLIPFRELLALARSHAAMENMAYTLISQELQREQGMIGMLGSLSAEAKVARFLVTLSDRFIAMGYSGKLFNLRMSRHDIGGHLGLTLETVSRSLSALSACGLITVQRRRIGLVDIPALRNLRRLPPHPLPAPALSSFAA